MPSPVQQVFGLYELTECIILQLNCPVEILRVQRVSRTWRDVIQNSPRLLDACWYPGRDAPEPSSGRQTWKLNPVYNRIGVFGVSVQIRPDEIQEHGSFNLTERIYDKPGSWTTILATQPPCRRIEVECYGNYSGDETM